MNEVDWHVADSKFWSSTKGQVVRAIVLNRAYTRTAILEVTKLSEKELDTAVEELFQARLLQEKDNDKIWVTRELFWQCINLFAKSQKKESKYRLAKDNSQEKRLNDHVTKKQFLLEFFGLFKRDLGNPERWLTDNPNDIFAFIEKCAEDKLPAFISVQPERKKAQPLGIEKVFFDFDYCKKSESLTKEEVKKRKIELREEVKHFLHHLELLNIKPLVVRTRRGFHVHIFFDSVYEIDQNLDFWKKVYKQLQLGLLGDYNYRFVDQTVVGDINQMCRIPFSVHEKSGEECKIVNNQLEEDRIRSIEFFKLYGLKQKDCESAIEKAREVEQKNKQKTHRPIRYVKRKIAVESFNGIRPCFINALDSGEMCHQQRLALLNEAYSVGFHSPESIIDLFKRLNDFNFSITSYQVNYFFTKHALKGEIYRYKCKTIQRYGWCLGEKCPLLNQPSSPKGSSLKIQSDDEDLLQMQSEEFSEKCPDCGSDFFEAVPFFDKRFKCNECGYEWGY